MSDIKPVDVVVFLNMAADIYFRARQAGFIITPENIRDHIREREARAEANDLVMGIAE
jgi:hypothetical protein